MKVAIKSESHQMLGSKDTRMIPTSFRAMIIVNLKVITRMIPSSFRAMIIVNLKAIKNIDI